MDFWGMLADWGLASGWLRGEGERDWGGQSCRIIWSNQEQKAWRIVLRTADKDKEERKIWNGTKGVWKGPGHIWRHGSFIFKLKSAEETEKTPPGGLPLISVGNVKQSWPTPEQLTQNQPLTPAVWSICNSNLGIAMKTTFCSGCLQEFI